MSTSLNVLFAGTPPPDPEFEHPRGCSIARLLHERLQQSAWDPADFDNWRDCGWSIECTRDGSLVQISIADVPDVGWLLQVAPTSMPGLVGRLRKKVVSATPQQIFDLAITVHAILSSSELFSDFQWCWEGYPEDEDTTPIPTDSLQGS